MGGGTLLDLGCGDGGMLDTVAPRYASAIGIDIDDEPIARREAAPRWQFIAHDLDTGIPLEASTVDVVHANQVIEHVRNPLFFCSEAHRVLKPGGTLILATPNIRYLRHLFRLIVRGWGPMTSTERPRSLASWDDGHLHYFTPGDLEWIARTAGFDAVGTLALVDTTGSARLLRMAVATCGRWRLVKAFLSGNALLIARR